MKTPHSAQPQDRPQGAANASGGTGTSRHAGGYSTVIVDDEKVLAQTLKIWLETRAGAKVVGMAESARSGWEMIQQLHPDLVLLDVGLPDGSGFDVAEWIKAEFPQTRIFILTCRVDPHTAWRATQLRVHGLIDKTASLKNVDEAIRAVMSGSRFVGPVFQQIHSRLVAQSEAFYKILSDREQAVLSRLTIGMSDDAIAQSLEISPLTVICHRRNIRKKLELHDDRSLIAFGLRCGTFFTPPAI